MTETQRAGVPFPLLSDPHRYVPCQLDLFRDDARRTYWIELFRGHFPSLLAEAVRTAVDEGATPESARERAARAKDGFEAILDRYSRGTGLDGKLDILALCRARENCLRREGFVDAYRLVKQRETVRALELLPRTLRRLDALGGAERRHRIIRQIFAGNIFDLGATATAKELSGGPDDFYRALERLKPRPWLVDDLDAWLARWQKSPPYRAAVLFVDNAGCDVVLGMLPFARELAREGTRVLLAANSGAALNDITYPELVELLDAAAALDPILREAQDQRCVRAVPSGNEAPLIDLDQVSLELAEATAQAEADLVVLEGMGRALESNYDAKFEADCIKLALVKDPDVGSWFGGTTYDVVFRFERARR